MKNARMFTFVLILGALLLSACGAPAAAATPAPVATGGSAKIEAMPVAFIGIVDSIDGDQWVISGTTVTVSEGVLRDGPFNAGDQVKVEGLVNPDGSLTILRVESPGSKATATVPPTNDDNSNEAPGNANTNDTNINDSNSNDDNSNGVSSNDNNSNDNNGGNSNDDNGGNSNDDNGGNSNDDNGGNSNDDNGNDDNGGNSNDDNGNDDNGGNSNDDNGNDDNGGNSNDD